MSPTGDLSRELETAGKEPLRYLNRSLLDDENARRQARARIRGLRDLATVNAWISVEKKLERGPRTTVLEWLEERRDDRLKNGVYDFDDWLEDTPKADPPEVPSVTRYVREVDGEPVATDGSDRGPRVTTQRPALEAFLERREEREKQSSGEPREDQEDDLVVTDDVDTDSTPVAIADGGDDQNQENEEASDTEPDACPECDGELVEHKINGETGLWCHDCTEFRGTA